MTKVQHYSKLPTLQPAFTAQVKPRPTVLMPVHPSEIPGTCNSLASDAVPLASYADSGFQGQWRSSPSPPPGPFLTCSPTVIERNVYVSAAFAAPIMKVARMLYKYSTMQAACPAACLPGILRTSPWALRQRAAGVMEADREIGTWLPDGYWMHNSWHPHRLSLW